MSLFRLLLYTALDLIVVLIIAAAGMVLFAESTTHNPQYAELRALEAIGVPMKLVGLQEKLDQAAWWRYSIDIECVTVPPDDQALLDWVRAQSEVQKVRVYREALRDKPQGETTEISVRYFGSAGMERLDIPWEQFGFVAGKPEPRMWWFRGDPPQEFNLTDHHLRLIAVGWVQTGMLLVGLFHLWRRRNVAPAPTGSEGRALLIGLGIGLLLAVLYWAYDQAALHLVGPSFALSPCWNCLPSIDQDMSRHQLPDFWKSVNPNPIVMGALAFMAFLTPLAIAVFFWGGMFSRWDVSGRVRAGTILGSLVAAVLLLSWTFIPIAIVFALLLAWVHLKTRDFGVPLVALIVLNVAIIGVTFGAIPGLPHPANMLPGKWTTLSQEIELFGIPLGQVRQLPTLEFQRGGSVRSDSLVGTDETIRVRRNAWRYEWLDKERIRLLWTQRTFDMKNQIGTIEVEPITYRVHVNWRELTLTDERDGTEFKFRRDK